MTRFPIFAKAAARFEVTVDLPMPPFPYIATFNILPLLLFCCLVKRIKTFALLLAHNQITAPQFIWLNIQKTIFLAFCQKNGFANSYLVTISARILLAVRVFLFIVLKSFQLITVASFSTNVSQMCESDTAIL